MGEHRYERAPRRRRSFASPYPPIGHTFRLQLGDESGVLYCPDLLVLLQRVAAIVADAPEKQFTFTIGPVRATAHDIDLLGPED